jgi:hypothetical protein
MIGDATVRTKGAIQYEQGSKQLLYNILWQGFRRLASRPIPPNCRAFLLTSHPNPFISPLSMSCDLASNLT